MRPLVASYYLPQFHHIPENDLWWGNEFTEWTNLKRARPLFPGHRQPNYPAERRFYNLLEKSTVEWQSDLAMSHQIDAFCMYHYWFDGRQLLERPAQNYLSWRDIRTGFFFMWANHHWTRSWTGGREMLLRQSYGGIRDIKAHIDYLLPFFEDDRYTKIQNRPVFEIYLPIDIPYFSEMREMWDSRCREVGFDGVYFVAHLERDGDVVPEGYEAWTLEEHTASLDLMNRRRSILTRVAGRVSRQLRNYAKEIPRVYKYADVVRCSTEISTRTMRDPRFIPQVCTGWDNTPRYGSRGYLVDGCTPELFHGYFDSVYKAADATSKPLLMVPCWNEWCEGMVLEPTEELGTGLLGAIKRAVEDSSHARKTL